MLGVTGSVWRLVGYIRVGGMLGSLQGKCLGSQHCPPSSGVEELCSRASGSSGRNWSHATFRQTQEWGTGLV